MPKRKPTRSGHVHVGDAASTITPTKKAKNSKTSLKSCTSNADVGQPQPNLTDEDDSAVLVQFTKPAEIFARLIHPMDPEVFFDQHWEKQPTILTKREKNEDFFQSFFTRTILDEIVAKKRVSFIRDCNVCRYKGEKRESLNGMGILKPRHLKDLLDKSKATVQFHQPQRFQDSIWWLLENLESYFGCLVGSNVYMTPRGSQGLAPHYDDVEVFVLQLEGEKRWRLYEPPIPLPRDYSRDLDQSEIGEPTLDVTLKAGDLMYFPRGTVHQAETPNTCSHSTHLTISTYQRSAWGDLLGHALPSILQSAIVETKSLRQGLPIRLTCGNQASSSDTTKKMKDLIAQLGNHIGSHGQEAANEMLCDFIANRLPPSSAEVFDLSPSGPMPSAKHKVRFRFPDHAFILRRRPDVDEQEEDEEEDGEGKEEFQLFVYHSLQNSRDEHMMSSDPKQAQGIQLPTECEAALAVLHKLGHTWQKVKDIELDHDFRSQMLTSLWAEGLLEVADIGKT